MPDRQALLNILKFIDRTPSKTERLIVEAAEITPVDWDQTRLWLLQQTKLALTAGAVP